MEQFGLAIILSVFNKSQGKFKISEQSSQSLIIVMRYVFILLMLMSCTRDMSFDPTVTISKEIIKFLYNESNKEEPVVE